MTSVANYLSYLIFFSLCEWGLKYRELTAQVSSIMTKEKILETSAIKWYQQADCGTQSQPRELHAIPIVRKEAVFEES